MSNDLSNFNSKPADVSEEEWNAIDLNDPLMWVC
jgi:hypothetical protein